MTFLTKGQLIAKMVKGQYRITADGHRYLEEYPVEILVRDLRKQEGWKSAWKERKKHGDEPDEIDESAEQDAETPVELVDRGTLRLRDDLAERLLRMLLAQSATFFEHLVLDVLLAMGYGGSRESAAKHLGRSGDEGIDGRVNQDELGLDQIMVQAKRYAPDRPIDRQAVQAFIGSLAGQGVTKGIFITTSYFNENALEFVKRGANTKVVLVDGEHLIELMMRHHIGVRVERIVELLELDQNYFEDD
jgi:restriction system protein